MKTFIFSLLFITGCFAASAQCTAPTITASGPTAFCPGGSVTLSASDVWQKKADFGGNPRYLAVSFSIGNKGYIGTGFSSTGSSSVAYSRDFWEYDPSTNVWTQKADFMGFNRERAVGFSIGGFGYIGTGENGVFYKDFYQYNPATNAWVKKADFGGAARSGAVGFSIGSKGYIGTGHDDSGNKKDFWEYNPATDTWTPKTDFGRSGRARAVGFNIGSKGYIGTGNDGSSKKDFWEYDPSANNWTQKADFGGTVRHSAVAFGIGSKGYIGTGSDGSSKKDFWEYNPSANTWIQSADFGGSARYIATAFSIGGKGYIGTGQSTDALYAKDFWEFNPLSYSWSPGGQTTSSITVNTSGSYTVTTTNTAGCSATSAPTIVTVNTPTTPVITPSGPTTFCPGGSVTLSAPASDVWTRKADFGGIARGNPVGFSIGNKGYAGSGYYSGTRSDFWEFDPVTNTWTQKADFGGGGIEGAIGFSIGGKGYMGIGNNNNSFWQYDPATNAWTKKADFIGETRWNAVAFSIGNKGYVGTGRRSNATLLADFWEYDPTTDGWIRKTDFAGGARSFAAGFSIGSKGYIGTGSNGSYLKDFWEYNPSTNAWAQKADFGGPARAGAAGFSIGSKGYMGSGTSSTDFWEYDPSADTWLQKSSFGGSSRSQCNGFSIGSKGYMGIGYNFTDFWEYDPGYTYAWSPGGQTTSTITVSAAGNFTVTTTNALGCPATSAPTAVTVSTPVTPVINASGATTFCAGGSVTLTATAASSYRWYRDGNVITGATAQSYSATATDNYTVTTTNAAGCPATSAAITVTVNPAPAAPVITTSGSTALCSGGSVTLTSPAAASYQWYLNGNLLTGATARSYTASAAGSYTITTTNGFGCSATSVPAIVTENTPPAVPVITASGPTNLCSGSSVTLSAPAANSNAWTPKAAFGGGARYSATGFSIGSKGYVGTGSDGNGYKKDFWEYDPATNAWTQKADFGGPARFGAAGFSIGSKGYIGTGYDRLGYKKDFWEYDPAANTWIQKTNFGGTARESAVGFSNSGTGYIATGYDGNPKKDVWAYNPSTNTWAQVADFSGTARLGAVGFSIGSKGYIGTGSDGSINKKDFWEYDPTTNAWVQKADFGGSARYIATGFSIGNKGYLGTGYDGTSKNDFWEYNPASNTWVQKADFGGAGRSTAIGFSIGTKGYIGTGQLSNNSPVNDLYEYDPGSTYLWSPGGQTTPSITTNVSGNYSLTLTNAFGCSATSAVTAVKAFPAGTVYVDGSKAAPGDGSSWATAYTSLRDALYAASQCSSITTVQVAKGTYKPIDYANPDSAFVINRGGLKIYGGYPSGGGVRNVAANPTILSGDIGTSAVADNSYHILIIAGLTTTADSVVVDGFTITGGYAKSTGSALYNGISIDRNHGAAIAAEQNAGGKLALRNLIFANNAGGDGWGAALVLNTSNAILDKCIFYGNSTSGTGQGGAVWNNNSTTAMTNCLLYSNYGAGLGGAVQLNGGNPLTIINSTFYANRTGGNGAAIRSGAGSVLNLSNTIFYKNDVGTQNGAYAAPGNDLTLVGTYSMTNCMLQGPATGYSGAVNSVFGSDPMFANETSPAGADNIPGTADDGLRLQAGSPAINAGSSAAAAGIALDITGAARIQNGTVDMGAYESAFTPLITYYPRTTATDLSQVSNWTTDVAGGTGGSQPSNFTSPNQLFNVNGNVAKPQVLGSWTISGGSNLVLNNTDSLIFRPSASLTIGTGSSADFNGKSVTLKSTAAGTAFIGQISGSLTGASNVTVERYLSSSGNRAYRLLTPSVNTTTSIHTNWQEGATSRTDNPRPGYGTHITGDKVDQTGGFDATATGEGSLFTVSATAGYQYIPNTNATTLSAKSGYLIYIRGDRSIDLASNATPLPSTNTTLRATGYLLAGNQVFAGTSGYTGPNTGFNLVTNPYASPINWTSVYGANTGLTQFYTLFDPNIGSQGGYVTVNTIGIKSNPGSAATTNIQSGQAFFVQATTATAPTVTIQEVHKSTVSNIDVFRTGSQTELFTSSLFYTNAQGQRINADGVTSVYNNAYDTAVDGNDAEQIANFDEDVAIRRSGHDLSIESRPLIDLKDTIPFAVARLQTRTYEWEFSASNFNAPGLTAVLVDRFTGARTAISLSGTTVVAFAATTDPASKAANRFAVVFAQGVNTPLPLSGLSVKAYEKSKDIQVEWTVQTETGTDRYEVEKSTDARQFTKAATVTATNATNALSYNWLDVSAAQGSHYYRIKAVDKSGEVQYSKVVRVDIGKAAYGIAVYPNPVTDNVISLTVNLPKGAYTVTLTSAAGQRAYQTEIVHLGGSATQPLRLSGGLAQGLYQVSVSDGKTTFVQQVIKQQ